MRKTGTISKMILPTRIMRVRTAAKQVPYNNISRFQEKSWIICFSFPFGYNITPRKQHCNCDSRQLSVERCNYAYLNSHILLTVKLLKSFSTLSTLFNSSHGCTQIISFSKFYCNSNSQIQPLHNHYSVPQYNPTEEYNYSFPLNMRTAKLKRVNIEIDVLY